MKPLLKVELWVPAVQLVGIQARGAVLPSAVWGPCSPGAPSLSSHSGGPPHVGISGSKDLGFRRWRQRILVYFQRNIRADKVDSGSYYLQVIF